MRGLVASGLQECVGEDRGSINIGRTAPEEGRAGSHRVMEAKGSEARKSWPPARTASCPGIRPRRAYKPNSPPFLLRSV